MIVHICLLLECEYRHFGEDCSKTCHCYNNITCNGANGMCENGVCDPGWKGNSCSESK